LYQRNLATFSGWVRSQGLKLLMVELAFGQQSFSLDEDMGDVLVRRRTTSLLWQKERLLNIGIAHLPATCDKVVWLDADILFENPHWVRETAELLQEYALVQPFDRALWLPEDPQNLPSAPPRGLGEGHWMPGMAAVMSQRSDWRRALADYFQHGHCGFAWAARRDILAHHGLYDRHVLGGGDVTLAHAFFGDEDYWRGRNYWCRHFTKAEMSAIAAWSRAVHEEVQASVAAVPGRLLHLWHGSMAGRGYQERSRILRDNHFDPLVDVTLDEQECLTWCTHKPDLHRRAAAYFAGRAHATAPQTSA
jgi:hypothetical protein